jgi:hypothetical protein
MSLNMNREACRCRQITEDNMRIHGWCFTSPPTWRHIPKTSVLNTLWTPLITHADNTLVFVNTIRDEQFLSWRTLHFIFLEARNFASLKNHPYPLFRNTNVCLDNPSLRGECRSFEYIFFDVLKETSKGRCSAFPPPPPPRSHKEKEFLQGYRTKLYKLLYVLYQVWRHFFFWNRVAHRYSTLFVRPSMHEGHTDPHGDVFPEFLCKPACYKFSVCTELYKS